MRRFVFCSLSFLLVAIFLGQAAAQTGSKALVFSRVTVIDGTGSPAKPNMTVVIIGDRIVDIGATGNVEVPRGAQIIDGRGKFLIPGLWDMHVHLEPVGEVGLKLFIANGVTGIREMGGGDFAQIKLWRQKIFEGSLLGPQIKASGPILESPRFIQTLERITGKSLTGKRIGVGTVADARSAVDLIVGLGADFLKIRTNASAETYKAIAVEARRVGLPLVGHAPTGVSLIEASDAGQKSIEHGPVFLNNYTEAQWTDIAASFLKNGTHAVPTLISDLAFRQMADQEVMAIIDDHANRLDPRRKYVSPKLVKDWREMMESKKQEWPPFDWKLIKEKNVQGFRLLHKAGVRMMAGTDIGAPLVFPAFSLHDELRLLVSDIGMTPMEALQSATRIPAEFLGMGDSLGTIQKGKLADLVLLQANPIEDISNTQKIDVVVVRGKPFGKGDLNKMLNQAEISATNNHELRAGRGLLP